MLLVIIASTAFLFIAVAAATIFVLKPSNTEK